MSKPGRPKLDKSNKAKTRSLAFNERDWAELTKLGRARWIRLKIKEEILKNN